MSRNKVQIGSKFKIDVPEFRYDTNDAGMGYNLWETITGSFADLADNVGGRRVGIGEQQKLVFNHVPAQGSFTLYINNTETISLNYNATYTDINNALLTILGSGNITTSGDFTNGFIFSFKGLLLGRDVYTLELHNNTLKKADLTVCHPTITVEKKANSEAITLAIAETLIINHQLNISELSFVFLDSAGALISRTNINTWFTITYPDSDNISIQNISGVSKQIYAILSYPLPLPNLNLVENAGTSTDNAIPRFDGVTGKVIQNSGIIVDDSNNITGINNLTANNQLQLSTKTTEKSHALSFSGASAGNVCVRTLAITSFEQGTLELEIYGTFSYGNYAGKIIIKAFKQYNLLTIQEMVSYGLLSSACHISGITCGNADGTCTLLIAYNSTAQAILWGIHYKTTATAITSSTLSNETIGSSSAHWNANIVPSANVDNAMSALTDTGFVYDMPMRVLAPASRTAIYATANGNGYSAVHGSNSGTNGYGVYGTASAAYGNGGYFTNTYDGGANNDSYGIYASSLSSTAIYATSRDSHGIQSFSSGTSKIGVRGVVSGSGSSGLQGELAPTQNVGKGVYGYSGYNDGLAGSACFGVYGFAISGTGVYGTSTKNHGVFGTITGAGEGSGIAGVAGLNAHASGYGGFFENTGGGHGVHGKSSGYAVYGEGTSSGTGVYGSTVNGYGVRGVAGSGGTGVRGEATNGDGVSGYSDTGYGVRGNTVWGNYLGFSLNNGTSTVPVYRNSTSGYLTTSTSDRTLKKDIEDLNYGLSELKQINFVTFRWKTDKNIEPKKIGLIAQQVKPLVPELFFDTKIDNEPKIGFYENHMGSFVGKAVQDLAKIVDAQQEQINNLITETNKLKGVIA